MRALIRRDWSYQPSQPSKEHRLLSIRKAPAGFFRRFVRTLRRQLRLRLIRARCCDQFRHYHRSRQPRGRLSQIMQVSYSCTPHLEEALLWLNYAGPLLVPLTTRTCAGKLIPRSVEYPRRASSDRRFTSVNCSLESEAI